MDIFLTRSVRMPAAENGEQAAVQHAYEHLLHENERRLREAARIARLGYWELDIKANQLHWSPETFSIFEVDPNKYEPSYEAFLELIHPDDRELVKQEYAASVKNRKPYNVYHRLTTKSGAIKFVNERCHNFYNENGEPVRSLGTVLDITDHEREIEKLLRAQCGLRIYASGLEEEIKDLTELLEARSIELAHARALIESLMKDKALPPLGQSLL